MNFGGGGGTNSFQSGRGSSLVETILIQLIARGIVFALKNKPTICINNLPPVLNSTPGPSTSSQSMGFYSKNPPLSTAKAKTNYILKKRAIALLAEALSEVMFQKS